MGFRVTLETTMPHARCDYAESRPVVWKRAVAPSLAVTIYRTRSGAEEVGVVHEIGV